MPRTGPRGAPPERMVELIEQRLAERVVAHELPVDEVQLRALATDAAGAAQAFRAERVREARARQALREGAKA